MATTPTLSTEITYVTSKIVDLEHKNCINVVMTIDDTLAILKQVKTDLIAIKGDTTYNLTTTADEHCTISVTRNGVPVSAGTGVLALTDVLVISVAFSEGYELNTLKVNNVSFTSGNSTTVLSNVSVVATSKSAG